MQKGYITVYYGAGRGKTTAAIGQGLIALGEGRRVIMVRFLDGNKTAELEPLRSFEPDFKVFRFSKARSEGAQPSESELKAELTTAMQFSRKILETGECDVLILDGITDAIQQGFLAGEELCRMLAHRTEYLEVMITGVSVFPELTEMADNVYHIRSDKETV